MKTIGKNRRYVLQSKSIFPSKRKATPLRVVTIRTCYTQEQYQLVIHR